MGYKARELRLGDPSHEHPSFFKVMFGEDFSKVLFLPPKFAKKIRNMVDQKFQLEDINKQIWTVTLSIVDGALAFQKGWTSFCKDHNLKIGDFLVFNLSRASHFVIHVYEQSGCSRLNFSTNNSQKRKRTRATQSPVDKHIHQTHTTDGASSNGHSSRSVFTPSSAGMNEANVIIPVPTDTVAASGSKFSEEAVYMLNRDGCYNNEDDGQRISLFDLSTFEQQTNGQAKKADMTVKPCRNEFVTSGLIGDTDDAIPAIVEVPNNLKNLEERSKTHSMDTLSGDARVLFNSCEEDPIRAVGNNNVTVENEIENVCTVPVRNEPVDDLDEKVQEEDARNESLAVEEGKEILLRGFDKRLWPVVYKSSNTMGNGWDAFVEANNIGANDFYIFKSEINANPDSSTPNIYSVCRS